MISWFVSSTITSSSYNKLSEGNVMKKNMFFYTKKQQLKIDSLTGHIDIFCQLS